MNNLSSPQRSPRRPHTKTVSIEQRIDDAIAGGNERIAALQAKCDGTSNVPPQLVIAALGDRTKFWIGCTTRPVEQVLALLAYEKGCPVGLVLTVPDGAQLASWLKWKCCKRLDRSDNWYKAGGGNVPDCIYYWLNRIRDEPTLFPGSIAVPQCCIGAR